MRVAFAGTPEFAQVALAALAQAGHEIVLVMSQPDRPAGRGMRLQACPVKALALENNWPTSQARSLRLDGRYPEDAAQAKQALDEADPEVLVVAAYGLLLPQWVLDMMQQPCRDGRRRWGCLNIHASLLPRWRGAAPIHRAIEAGDAQTGVTIMQMELGLDTGPMLLAEPMPIEATDTTATLHDKLAAQGARLVVQALQQIAGLQARKQPEEGVCYAHKIEKTEAALDWQLPASMLERRVRAFVPFPVASTLCRDEVLKVWRATPVALAGAAAPGTVVEVSANGLVVACGDGGGLLLQELQRAGGKRLAAQDFLRGFPIEAGQRLG